MDLTCYGELGSITDHGDDKVLFPSPTESRFSQEGVFGHLLPLSADSVGLPSLFSISSI